MASKRGTGRSRLTERPSFLKLCGLIVAAGSLLLLGLPAFSADDSAPARDPKQPVDEEYTSKIHEYTTAPNLTSPLVDYLPASKTVPTPKAVLGDVAGARGQG